MPRAPRTASVPPARRSVHCDLRVRVRVRAGFRVRAAVRVPRGSPSPAPQSESRAAVRVPHRSPAPESRAGVPRRSPSPSPRPSPSPLSPCGLRIARSCTWRRGAMRGRFVNDSRIVRSQVQRTPRAPASQCQAGLDHRMRGPLKSARVRATRTPRHWKSLPCCRAPHPSVGHARPQREHAPGRAAHRPPSRTARPFLRGPNPKSNHVAVITSAHTGPQ